jgi:hypothetical protein
MVALIFSFVLLTYVIVPGIGFRRIFHYCVRCDASNGHARARSAVSLFLRRVAGRDCTKIVQRGQFRSLLSPIPSTRVWDSGYGRKKGTTPLDFLNFGWLGIVSTRTRARVRADLWKGMVMGTFAPKIGNDSNNERWHCVSNEHRHTPSI